MLALLVDWGYRSDGIPVRLFDAWTTLPAGPATLAAKTGVAILPVAIRRARPDGRYGVLAAEPIAVASDDPADLQRATQPIADALAATIARRARAVVQLQADVAGDRPRRADLERRARRDAGRPAGPRVRRAACRATRPTRSTVDRRGGRRVTSAVA